MGIAASGEQEPVTLLGSAVVEVTWDRTQAVRVESVFTDDREALDHLMSLADPRSLIEMDYPFEHFAVKLLGSRCAVWTRDYKVAVLVRGVPIQSRVGRAEGALCVASDSHGHPQYLFQFVDDARHVGVGPQEPPRPEAARANAVGAPVLLATPGTSPREKLETLRGG